MRLDANLWDRPAHKLVKVFGQDASDRMNSVVPTQPFPLQSAEGVNNDRLAKSELILDHDVDCRVQPYIRKPNSVAAVVRSHELQPPVLGQLEPFFSGRRHVRIVRPQLQASRILKSG